MKRMETKADLEPAIVTARTVAKHLYLGSFTDAVAGVGRGQAIATEQRLICEEVQCSRLEGDCPSTPQFVYIPGNGVYVFLWGTHDLADLYCGTQSFAFGRTISEHGAAMFVSCGRDQHILF